MPYKRQHETVVLPSGAFAQCRVIQRQGYNAEAGGWVIEVESPDDPNAVALAVKYHQGGVWRLWQPVPVVGEGAR